MGFMKILEPGFLTTVQDAGRYGYRTYGMPVSGALDWYSFMTGNLLAGNHHNTPSLEITITGPVIEFTGSAVIALTGANMTPMINGIPVNMWCSLRLKRKDRLSFGPLETGARVYLAISGGIDVPPVMGSASTYLRAKTGGFQGRKMAEGDKLSFRTRFTRIRKRRKLPIGMIPEWRTKVNLPVLPGVDYDKFPPETIATFLSEPFRVTNYSDRMGIRLSGPALKHLNSADVISYPLASGTIQVPGNGNPVIMLADSQTVGGYTQIANISSSDLYKCGQLMPGNEVCFQLCDHEEAVGSLNSLKSEIYGVFSVKD